MDYLYLDIVGGDVKWDSFLEQFNSFFIIKKRFILYV